MNSPVAALSLRVPAGPLAPRMARHSVQGLEAYVSEEEAEKVQLLVSELVTNSFRHAQIGPDDWIELSVTSTPRAIHVEVLDPGAGFVPTDPPIEPVGGTTSGWGLFILDHTASRWGVERDSSTRVWFELDRETEAAVAAQARI